MADAAGKKLTLYTSTLALAEVRRLRESRKELTESERIKVNEFFKKYLEHEWIQLIEVDRAIGEKAQELGAKYGMSPTDAIHLASAISEHCNVLLLWDKPTFLARVRDNPCEGVHLMEPYWEGVTPMPSARGTTS